MSLASIVTKISIPSVCLLALATEAPAQSNCAWQAYENLVVIEVESVDPEGGWIEVTDQPNYTGDSFYRWNGPNHFNNPGNGTILYEFEVHTAGEYQMRIRNRHNHPDSTEENDCWTRMDGGNWIKTFSNGNGTVGQWTMRTKFELGGSYPDASYVLGVGRHVLAVSGRSHNFMIDRIHFYNNSVANGDDFTHPESDCKFGGSYCSSTPNSTGSAALIDVSGSVSVSDNNFHLAATSVPNQPGIFYFGNQRANAPFGDGTRCVGGQTVRLSPTTASGSTLQKQVDLSAPPAVGAITPSSTWNFQAWYRDPAAGGSGFNLSDGMQVNFMP